MVFEEIQTMLELITEQSGDKTLHCSIRADGSGCIESQLDKTIYAEWNNFAELETVIKERLYAKD